MKKILLLLLLNVWVYAHLSAQTCSLVNGKQVCTFIIPMMQVNALKSATIDQLHQAINAIESNTAFTQDSSSLQGIDVSLLRSALDQKTSFQQLSADEQLRVMRDSRLMVEEYPYLPPEQKEPYSVLSARTSLRTSDTQARAATQDTHRTMHKKTVQDLAGASLNDLRIAVRDILSWNTKHPDSLYPGQWSEVPIDLMQDAVTQKEQARAMSSAELKSLIDQRNKTTGLRWMLGPLKYVTTKELEEVLSSQ